MTETNQQETKTPSSTCEVVETVQALPEAPDTSLKGIRAQIRKTLVECDPEQVDTWDELTGMVDTNQYNLLNMQQAQTLVQEAQAKFYERKEKADRLLKKLLEDESNVEAYLAERDRHQKEERETQKHILKLMDIVLKLAKEHRQSIMQKKFYLQVSHVRTWIMAVNATLHRRIEDKKLLAIIAEEIAEAGRVLFPVAAGDEQ